MPFKHQAAGKQSFMNDDPLHVSVHFKLLFQPLLNSALTVEMLYSFKNIVFTSDGFWQIIVSGLTCNHTGKLRFK